jgi:hypothetical protein
MPGGFDTGKEREISLKESDIAPDAPSQRRDNTQGVAMGLECAVEVEEPAETIAISPGARGIRGVE